MRSLWLRALAVLLGGSMLLIGCLPDTVAYAASEGATPVAAQRAKADVLMSANWRTVRQGLLADGYTVLYSGIQVLPDQGNGNLAIVEVPSQIRGTNQGALDVFIVDRTSNAIVGESLVTVAPQPGTGNYAAQVKAPGNTISFVLDGSGRILSQSTAVNSFSPIGQGAPGGQTSPLLTTQQECQAGIAVTGVLYCAVWGFVGVLPGIICGLVFVAVSYAC